MLSRPFLFGELCNFDQVVHNMFNDLGNPALAQQAPSTGKALPEVPVYHLPIDILRSENGYRVVASVPGYAPEQVEVNVSDGVLTINASKSVEVEQEGVYHLRRERAHGSLLRRIRLPKDANSQAIGANFDNGVLTIEIPKLATDEPKRIQVQVHGQPQLVT